MAPARALTDPDVAKALAHPLRVRLLALFEEGTASPTQLADVTGANLPRVSYHVRRLAAVGLIELVRTEPRRGAVEHYYAAVRPPVIAGETWAALPAAVRTATVGTTLQQLRDDLNAAVPDGGFDRADVQLARVPLRVDEQGWRELAGRMAALLEDVEAIARSSEARLARNGGDGAIDAVSALMLFERVVGDTARPRTGGSSAAKRSRRRAQAR